MNLVRKYGKLRWPKSHFVYVEKLGTSKEAIPQAWKEMKKFEPEIAIDNKIKAFASLYRTVPVRIFRAGLFLAEKPLYMPEGLQYTEFPGGKYMSFVFTGPYSELGEAGEKVGETVQLERIPLRDGFYIEHYINDPNVVAENQIQTEILIPVI